MLVTAVQVALMLGTVWLMEDAQGSWSGRLLAMLLAAWNGVGIGLLISVVATNGDKAMSVVPLTLIPQIVLGGVLVAIPDMNAGTKLVSLAASSRWATRACEVSMFDGETINTDLLKESYLRPLWNLYPDDPLNTAEGRVKFRFIRCLGGDSNERNEVRRFHPAGMSAMSRGLSVRDTPGAKSPK